MSGFLKYVDETIASCEENGGKEIFFIAPRHQSCDVDQMVYMASRLPRTLEKLSLLAFGHIYGKEIADHMPPALKSISIANKRSADPSILHLHMPTTLRRLSIRNIDFSQADSLLISTWIERIPAGLEDLDIMNCPLSRGEAALLADHLPPKLVCLAVHCEPKGRSSDDNLAIMKGQETIVKALSGSKNILSIISNLDDKAIAASLTDKNTVVALDLIGKMRADTLTKEDVGEALQRLPAIGYLAVEQTYIDDKCLGLEREEIARMVQNLAKEARKQGVFMPSITVDGGADLEIIQNRLQDRGHVDGIMPKTATVALPGSTATITSAKAAGTLLQTIVAGGLEALCAQSRAKGERFNAPDFTTPVPVPGFGDMPLVQVIAEQGELATLCNPANWAGNVRDLSAVLEAVSPELQAENNVDARAVHLKATQLTMQQGRGSSMIR